MRHRFSKKSSQSSARNQARSGNGRTNQKNTQSTNSNSQRSDAYLDPSEVLVIGRRAVAEAIQHKARQVRAVLLVSKVEGSDATIQQITQSAQLKAISVQSIEKRALENLAKSDAHQGIAAIVRLDTTRDFKDLLKDVERQSDSRVVLLDEVEDPHNLGAIFRASECFSADALVWSHNRGVQLTSVAIKSSAGAALLVPNATVSNSADALIKLKQEGFWAVGAECDPLSTSLYDFDAPKKIVLVLGSEGQGIRPVLKKLLDYSLYIPMQGKLDSLNVGQAAAVFLAQLSGKMQSKK